MSAAHIPGPWKVFEHSWSETSVLAEGFDHGICSLDINHATEESQEADEALMAANARLIAAAPDLLAALDRIAVNAADMAEAPTTAQAEKVMWRICAEDARAAIAKATGSAA